MPELLLPFLGVTALLTVTPGPDMLLVVRNGLSAGVRGAWRTGLGCCVGISVHATAAVLGLSAILAASADAYAMVKLAGAAYLAYLGVRMLASAVLPGRSAPETAAPQTSTAQTSTAQAASHPAAQTTTARTSAVQATAAQVIAPQATGHQARGGGAAYRQGLVTNLLNPKIALLFLTLLPQFVAAGEPRLRTTAFLAAVFLGIAVLWWRTFSLAIGPISRLLRGRRSRRTLDAVAGSALVAIGVRVALEGDR